MAVEYSALNRTSTSTPPKIGEQRGKGTERLTIMERRNVVKPGLLDTAGPLQS